MSFHDIDGIAPQLPDSEEYWVAPGARLIGRIILRPGASVWFNAVLRGDNETITLGDGSNIQDGTVCHTDMGFPLEIGPNCTIGHMAILHGCTIEAESLVGMGTTILNGAVIGSNSLVGAGSLVTEGKVIPEGTLAVGRPARVVRDLSAEEIKGISETAKGYRRNAARYRAGLTPSRLPLRQA